MMLSILILTHNRPQLFKRALTSVLNNLPDYEIEILVNNDSQDIEEIYSDDVHIEYSYFTDADLSLVYKHLFDRAIGDYVFFLEDDDYINKNFFEDIDFVSDVYYLEYTSNPLMTELGPVCHYKRMTTANKQAKKETVISSFLQKYDTRSVKLPSTSNVDLQIDLQITQVVLILCKVTNEYTNEQTNYDLGLEM